MAAQVYITKPQTVVTIGRDVWNFERFVRWLIDNDHPRFNVDFKASRKASRVDAALERDAKSPALKLRDEDQKALAEAANAPVVLINGQPTPVYPANPARQWSEYVRAISRPSSAPPAALATEPPAEGDEPEAETDEE